VATAEVAVTISAETFPASGSDPDAGARVAALYEAHGRTVLGLCRFLLRDPTEAEDAAQQSFLSAYRSLLAGAVPREPAAWLGAIARNECWARIRRRMREPLALHDVPSVQADPLEVAAQNADLAALRQGLEALSRPQREAFMLREFAGLSYAELAVALGVTEPAVDSLLFRARTSLRRALSAANGVLVPVALRDQLARLIPGFDQPAASALAKLVSLPIAAKLAAAGAGAVLVVVGSTGFERHASATAGAATPPAHRPRAASTQAPARVERTLRLLPSAGRAITAAAPRLARPQAVGHSIPITPKVSDPPPRPELAPSQENDGALPTAGGGTDPVPAPPPTGGVGITPTSGGGAPPTEVGDPAVGPTAGPTDAGPGTSGSDDPAAGADSSGGSTTEPAADPARPPEKQDPPESPDPPEPSAPAGG
jgi:RNA polymerase sigma-70 factor (ECF subfamily)